MISMKSPDFHGKFDALRSELKNSGASETVILDFVQRGLSDERASEYIAQREHTSGGTGWVYQGRSRRKR